MQIADLQDRYSLETTFFDYIGFLFIYLFIYYKFIYLFLAALGFRCCTRAFSSCCERGATLRCGARTAHCGGFSCCGARALGTRLQ